MITQKLANAIIKNIKALYKPYGVKIVLNSDEYFLDGEKTQESSAYLDYNNKIIHVSTKDRLPEEWLTNTFHETSHVDQMLADNELWKNSFRNNIDIDVIAQLWIDGHIDLNPYQIEQIFRAMMHLELDAEKRTVQKIYNYKLPAIDIPHYIQCAHAYALGYVVTGYVKEWIPAKKQPYTVPELVKQMPTMFTELNNIEIITLKKVFHEFYPELFNKPKPSVYASYPPWYDQAAQDEMWLNLSKPWSADEAHNYDY